MQCRQDDRDRPVYLEDVLAPPPSHMNSRIDELLPHRRASPGNDRTGAAADLCARPAHLIEVPLLAHVGPGDGLAYLVAQAAHDHRVGAGGHAHRRPGEEVVAGNTVLGDALNVLPSGSRPLGAALPVEA